MNSDVAASPQFTPNEGLRFRPPQLLFLILLPILTYVDFFGVKSATSAISSNMFQRLLSAVHYNPTAYSESSVFLIDESYVGPQGYRKRLSYTTQLEVFKAIIEKRPKALYLNFLYHTPHGSALEIKDFVDELTKHSKKFDVPVFIPVLMEGDGFNCSQDYKHAQHNNTAKVDKNSVIPLIRQKFESSYIGWVGCQERYPLFLSGSTHYPSPALRMYEYYCHENPHMCDMSSSFEAEGFHDPMVVQWGFNTSEKHSKVSYNHDFPCQDSITGPLASGLYLLTRLGEQIRAAMSGQDHGGLLAKCPHIDTFYASWMYSLDDYTQEYFDSSIKNRYVFVGSESLVRDECTNSPVHGAVPSVYLHAMSFDNLLNYGRHYVRKMSSWQQATIEYLLVLVIIVFLTQVNKRERVRLSASGSEVVDLLKRSANLLAIFVVAPLVSVWSVAALCVFYGYAPIDWIGVIGAVGLWQLCLKYPTENMYNARARAGK